MVEGRERLHSVAFIVGEAGREVEGRAHTPRLNASTARFLRYSSVSFCHGTCVDLTKSRKWSQYSACTPRRLRSQCTWRRGRLGSLLGTLKFSAPKLKNMQGQSQYARNQYRRSPYRSKDHRWPNYFRISGKHGKGAAGSAYLTRTGLLLDFGHDRLC